MIKSNLISGIISSIVATLFTQGLNAQSTSNQMTEFITIVGNRENGLQILFDGKHDVTWYFISGLILTLTILILSVRAYIRWKIKRVSYNLTNITEISQYQNELENNKHDLEETNLMLSNILSQTPCAMFIKDVDDDYRYIVSNKMFCDYQKKEEAYIVGKTDYELFSLEDAEKFRHDDEISVANNATYSFAEDVIWHGRGITWYTTKAVITTNNGKKLLMGISQDITESTKRQKELEISKKKTDIAIAASGIILWEYDCLKREFFVNKETTLIKLGHLIFEEYPQLMRDEDKVAFYQTLDMMNDGRDENFTLNIKYKTEDISEWKFAAIAGSPSEKDDCGRVIRYLGFHKDTTEWVQLNEEIDTSNTLLNSFIQAAPMGLFVKDINDDYRYVVANGIIKQMNMLDNIDIIGKSDYDIFDKSIADMFRKQDMNVVSRFTGDSIVYRSEFILGGRSVVYETTDTVITTGGGQRFILGVIADITETERAIVELQQAKDRAEQSDKLKSAFLANMSHEIRTPLNSIVGFSGLLIEAQNDEEKVQYNQVIQSNSELLLHLISDILDLSKVEAGIIDFKTERFDLASYFNDLANALKQRVTNPDIEFIVDNPYQSCMVEFDKNRMAQIITNYVNNALKYTVKGYIKMGYRHVDGGIKLYVKDTGIGIAKDKQSRVFRRFEKLDEFAQGTGLGLSICKAITEINGGKVGFDSEEGKGSLFWAWKACNNVVIQGNGSFEDQPIITKEKIKPRDISGIKILIAEDKDSNFLLLKHTLNDCYLTRVLNGSEAVKAVHNDVFDIVLMDIRMPIMDGIEATRKIREFNKSIPIIAVTANAFDLDKISAISAGCNNFTTKPINKKELFSIMQSVL